MFFLYVKNLPIVFFFCKYTYVFHLMFTFSHDLWFYLCTDDDFWKQNRSLIQNRLMNAPSYNFNFYLIYILFFKLIFLCIIQKCDVVFQRVRFISPSFLLSLSHQWYGFYYFLYKLERYRIIMHFSYIDLYSKQTALDDKQLLKDCGRYFALSSAVGLW